MLWATNRKQDPPKRRSSVRIPTIYPMHVCVLPLPPPNTQTMTEKKIRAQLESDLGVEPGFMNKYK